MNEYPFIPFNPVRFSEHEMVIRSNQFYELMQKRRSLRFFSDEPIPEIVLSNIIMTAGTAPSGANKQPWSICVVTNPKLKHEIRMAAEKEEQLSYSERMPEEWLADLAPLGTDWHKPFLETSPALIVVFKRNYEVVDGRKKNNYYVTESVGIAVGMLLAAIQNAGLCALTHTPSPMGFLKNLLQRPENETPFLLIPIGYPAADATVPDIERKAAKDFVFLY
ncbi:MAG TPA: nitroreductase family protein [Chitinophagales bacterium]|nr:nitroreductase family protein [Chitinophagales bacterium]HRG27288.1 nitroreductase family protein [Chitinophagales bacterium]HRG84613.1 nitroreductase family protein [Chitinophagales bacterium]HRH52676.1 nitroreductase family protein [Chitinophagales bacterium]